MRTYVALLVVLYGSAVVFSLALSIGTAAREYRDLALFTARSFFQEVVITRRWNALHGGVYVPVTEGTPPNPYLDDPARDVVTPDGLHLTKLNPAYMTRLISEVVKKEGGTRFHITSLRPIRPENVPDPWERESLETFERGETERSAVTGTGEGELFRFMAALKTEESCLKCHAKQGYKIGDVRGGISVTFPYLPFSHALAERKRSSWVLHLLFLTLGEGFILWLGRNLVGRVRELQESIARIRKLEGLLPICAGCKKIRLPADGTRQQEAWEPIEKYVRDRTDAEFTHGMCPECARKYFGDFARP